MQDDDDYSKPRRVKSSKKKTKVNENAEQRSARVGFKRYLREIEEQELLDYNDDLEQAE